MIKWLKVVTMNLGMKLASSSENSFLRVDVPGPSERRERETETSLIVIKRYYE